MCHTRIHSRLRFKFDLECCPDVVHKEPRSSELCSGVSNSIPRSSARALASCGGSASVASCQKLEATPVNLHTKYA